MPKRASSAATPVAKQKARVTTRAAAAKGGTGTPASKPDETGTSSRVVISTRSGATMSIPFGLPLQQAALEWSRIVRNRLRWATQPDARNEQALHSREVLKSLGLDLKAVDQLAAEPAVQITIPYIDEEIGWEARVFPWEYVLSAALRGVRTNPVVVVRHLDRQIVARPGRPVAASPDPVLILESAPGSLRERFQFDSERRLVASNLNDVRVLYLSDASPKQARQRIIEVVPGAIHLAGVDSHQGARLLGIEDPTHDGYMMVDDRGLPQAVRAEELASTLTSAKVLPRLIACNFQNSAARVAAMAVAMGADAAIGFQDVVDDSFTELMFATFYSKWNRLGWSTFDAFKATFIDLWTRPESLSGTGVVLWSGQDVFAVSQPVDVTPVVQVASSESFAVGSLGEAPAATPLATPRGVARAVAPPAGDQVERVDDEVGGVPPPPTPIGTMEPPPRAQPGAFVPAGRSEIWVEPRVMPRVNYSLLHNDRSLFDSFKIRKSVPETIPDVEVEVILYAGGDSFPYRTSLPLEDPITDIRERIRVPLTSTLLRGVRESVQSVVYVRVGRGKETIFQDTFRVSLIPIEEWVNNDDDAIWLPSFVLPRDPAVQEIVHQALGLLHALDDNGQLGFMGYQVVNDERFDPYDRVDLQARAIWSTISFQYDISYINPPPTYSPQAQRLRTPTEILRTRSGTCIDLALLYAACLESIDIYPVIILYAGHANVGYWRGNDLFEAFQIVQAPDPRAAARAIAPVVGGTNVGGIGPASPAPATSAGAGSTAAAAPLGEAQAIAETRDAPVVPWQLRRQRDESDPTLHELKTRVERGELSIVDPTLLTVNDGFASAVDIGKRSLDRRDPTHGRQFRSLVDIQIARRSGVTPLPIDGR
jgi:hypothetical protein